MVTQTRRRTPDLFVERSPANGVAIVAGLVELAFELIDAEHAEIQRGKDFVQLKNGPFDLEEATTGSGQDRANDTEHIEYGSARPAPSNQSGAVTSLRCGGHEEHIAKTYDGTARRRCGQCGTAATRCFPRSLPT